MVEPSKIGFQKSRTLRTTYKERERKRRKVVLRTSSYMNVQKTRLVHEHTRGRDFFQVCDNHSKERFVRSFRFSAIFDTSSIFSQFVFSLLFNLQVSRKSQLRKKVEKPRFSLSLSLVAKRFGLQFILLTNLNFHHHEHITQLFFTFTFFLPFLHS